MCQVNISFLNKYFGFCSTIIDNQLCPLAKHNFKQFENNIIHLLDRTETNIIFIWSGKVILGEAKPSPNITLPDQINMILGEVLSNKCFIIPATLCAPGPSHALLIQTKRINQEAIYHVPVRHCASLRVASFIFERRILLHSNWLRCDGIKSVLSQTR